MHRNTIVVSLTASFFLASVSVFGATGEKAEVKGMITTRTGETLVVKSAQGNVTVVLTDETTTKDDRGLLGLRKERMSNVVLIPGLKVDVDGRSDDQGRVVAKTITVDGDDLETAQMIQAGLHPTAEQVATNMRAIGTNQQNIATNKEQLAEQKGRLAAQQGQLTAQKGQLAAQKESVEANQKNIAANQQKIAANIKDIEENTNRFTALSEYDVKGAGTVKFNVGSSTISAKDQEELKRLAQTATGLKGYIIEVMGYADSTGSAAMNTKLSEDRARAVVTFLMQQCGVPVRHIVAPGAMGEYGPVAPNETKAGRAENRRVDIKILVNKGISGA
jgi:outer membrane protein OmpA-like peptidoglycan-associated protein